MRIQSLGEFAFVLRQLDARPAAVAAALEAAAIPGVVDIVPCAETVGVYVDAAIDPGVLASAALLAQELKLGGATHEIPVCYERGVDLRSVAATLGVSEDRVVQTHLGTEYECFAIGFCPGFAYLGPLPAELRGVPRLASPRTRTTPGSVAMTGNQTAVYPLPRPGGWPIIGQTPLTLVDEADDYFPISVGDRVRFVRVDEAEFGRLEGQRL